MNATKQYERRGIIAKTKLTATTAKAAESIANKVHQSQLRYEKNEDEDDQDYVDSDYYDEDDDDDDDDYDNSHE